MEMISSRVLQQRYNPFGDESGDSLRADVHVRFCTRAPSVDPQTADAQSKAFYRSSGHPWTRALG